MADDSSDTPTTPAATPATPRRRAPRKAAAPKAAAPKAAAKPATRARKETPATTDTAAKKPAKRQARTTKPRAATGRKSASRSEGAIDKVGGKWGAAAIAGGVAAIGAVATAAVLSLRGSTPKPADKRKDATGKGAHQPDGTDPSKSFKAKIADENTVPE